MRRYFHGSVLFLCILALCVSGCGGSGGSAADPMGTATVQFIDESGTVLIPTTTGGPFAFTVYPGESRQLIVKVTNARVDNTGKTTTVPVVNEYVSFTLLMPANGGSIRMVKERTDSSGRAIAMYTAGNNYAMDEVRATTEAGASAQLTILKTGGLVGKQITSLTPSSLSVPDGATSVITALVTDGNGNPVMGETVMFSFTVNASGAYFVTASQTNVGTFSATTDASGRVQAVYLAGSNSPTLTLYDTVRAALSNGSTQSVMITRTAATAPGALSITVKADPTSVSVGNVSIVTATVTGKDNAGVIVYFSLTNNNSGASLSASSAVTDGSGNASITYTAGSNNPDNNVQDTVTASVGNISSIVIITRSGGGGGGNTGSEVDLSATPTEVSGGEMSQITATVTNLAGSGPLRENVTLTIPVNNSGGTFINTSGASVNTITLYIDVDVSTASGSVIYKAGTNNSANLVQDMITATLGNGSTSSVIINRKGTAISGGDNIFLLSAIPSSVAPTNRLSVIRAGVSHDGPSGTIVDQTITFSIPVNKTGAKLIDSSGSRVSTITLAMKLEPFSSTDVSIGYEAGTAATTMTVDDLIQATLGNGATRVVLIEYTP